MAQSIIFKKCHIWLSVISIASSNHQDQLHHIVLSVWTHIITFELILYTYKGGSSFSTGHHAWIWQTFKVLFCVDLTHNPVLTPEKFVSKYNFYYMKKANHTVIDNILTQCIIQICFGQNVLAIYSIQILYLIHIILCYIDRVIQQTHYIANAQKK